MQQIDPAVLAKLGMYLNDTLHKASRDGEPVAYVLATLPANALNVQASYVSNVDLSDLLRIMKEFVEMLEEVTKQAQPEAVRVEGNKNVH